MSSLVKFLLLYCCCCCLELLLLVDGAGADVLDVVTTTSLSSSSTSYKEGNSRGAGGGRRSAIVATVAGPSKLSSYFEWTCRSIVYSRADFDLLIFHENNEVIMNKVKCADNVKFINLGKNGLSKLIVDKTLGDKVQNEKTRNDLKDILANIMIHMPRYLIEVKPMTGSLFEQWLKGYTHWSYTDLDIVWGNLTNWITEEDYEHDILTIAKLYDASRLFLRGQFTLHKNTDIVNNLWRKLTFFDPNDFATRLSGANKMLVDREDTNRVMDKFFHSAEGWYSQVVLHDDRLKIKVLGRGFDDFASEPIVLYRGFLIRCANKDLKSLKQCISDEIESDTHASALDLPPLHLKDVKTFSGESACRMFWLPIVVRYCIAVESKGESEEGDSHRLKDSLRMERLGESFMENGRWTANDEKLANRQFSKSGAFFHFRHWDDFLATSIITSWNENEMISTSAASSNSALSFPQNAADRDLDSEMQRHCMVLRVAEDRRMLFQTCDEVFKARAEDHPKSDNRSRVNVDSRGKLRGGSSSDTATKAVRNNREGKQHSREGRRRVVERLPPGIKVDEADSLLKTKRKGMERGMI